MNFTDEAAYKAYLAKCQKERARPRTCLRNHGEYIKYLTKIKEKEDDAHAAWAVTKANSTKKLKPRLNYRAIDARSRTRVSAPPKRLRRPAPAPAPKPQRHLYPPMSGGCPQGGPGLGAGPRGTTTGVVYFPCGWGASAAWCDARAPLGTSRRPASPKFA